MSVFNVIRRANYDDLRIVNERAEAFIKRHGLSGIQIYRYKIRPIWVDLDEQLEDGAKFGYNEHKRLLKLWRKVMNRALKVEAGHNVSMFSFNVGYWID